MWHDCEVQPLGFEPPTLRCSDPFFARVELLCPLPKILDECRVRTIEFVQNQHVGHVDLFAEHRILQHSRRGEIIGRNDRKRRPHIEPIRIRWPAQLLQKLPRMAESRRFHDQPVRPRFGEQEVQRDL